MVGSDVLPLSLIHIWSAEYVFFPVPPAIFLSTCEIMSTIIGALAGSIASSRVKMDLFGVIAVSYTHLQGNVAGTGQNAPAVALQM